MTTVPTNFNKPYIFQPDKGEVLKENAYNFALRIFQGKWDISVPGQWQSLEDKGWIKCEEPEEIKKILDVMLDYQHSGRIPFRCFPDWQPTTHDCVTIEFEQRVA